MSKWEMVRLEDVCLDMHQGINTVADEVEYRENGIPIIQSKNITKGYLDLDDVRYLDNDAYEKYKLKYNPCIGDLLICNIGTIGKSFTIVKQQKFLIAWNLFVVKLKADMVRPQYLQHYLNYLQKLSYYDRLLTGGTVKFINKTKMANIEIPLPKVEIQEHIAGILDKVQEIIVCHKKQIEELDNLIKATFFHMFGDIMLNENQWNIVRISDICENKIQSLKCNESSDIAYIDISSVNNIDKEIVSVQNINSDIAPSRAKQILEPYDILVSTVRPNLNSVAINNVSTERLVIGSTGYCVLRCKDAINYKYLFQITKSDYFINELVSVAKGASYPAVNNSDVKNVNIPLPPIDLQNKFADIVTNIEEQKTIVKKSLAESENLFNSLMSKYFD